MSDDNYDDIEEFELTEDILKALQDTEDRYTLTSASQAPAPPTQPPLPASVSSVATRRPPTVVARKALIDLDDTPDISITVDGSYAVQAPATVGHLASASSARPSLRSQGPTSSRSLSGLPSARPSASGASAARRMPPAVASVPQSQGGFRALNSQAGLANNGTRSTNRPGAPPQFAAPSQAMVSTNTNSPDQVQSLMAQLKQVPARSRFVGSFSLHSRNATELAAGNA